MRTKDNDPLVVDFVDTHGIFENRKKRKTVQQARVQGLLYYKDKYMENQGFTNNNTNWKLLGGKTTGSKKPTGSLFFHKLKITFKIKNVLVFCCSC